MKSAAALALTLIMFIGVRFCDQAFAQSSTQVIGLPGTWNEVVSKEDGTQSTHVLCRAVPKDLSKDLTWGKGTCSTTPWLRSNGGLLKERTCLEGRFKDYQRVIVSGNLQKSYTVSYTMSVDGGKGLISHGFNITYTLINSKPCHS